jgi:hypothetical protein
VCFGSLVRMMATFPDVESKIQPKNKFYIVLAGHCFVAMGHPFAMILTTQVRS